jgi:hypothetical protein
MLDRRPEGRSAVLASNDNRSDRLVNLRRYAVSGPSVRAGIFGVIAELGCAVCADFIAPGVFKITRH